MALPISTLFPFSSSSVMVCPAAWSASLNTSLICFGGVASSAFAAGSLLTYIAWAEAERCVVTVKVAAVKAATQVIRNQLFISGFL